MKYQNDDALTLSVITYKLLDISLQVSWCNNRREVFD